MKPFNECEPLHREAVLNRLRRECDRLWSDAASDERHGLFRSANSFRARAEAYDAAIALLDPPTVAGEE